MNLRSKLGIFQTLVRIIQSYPAHTAVHTAVHFTNSARSLQILGAYFSTLFRIYPRGPGKGAHTCFAKQLPGWARHKFLSTTYTSLFRGRDSVYTDPR